ncbi:MAG: hypothetical protein ACYTAN_10335 [Planctomycetota bacterium]
MALSSSQWVNVGAAAMASISAALAPGAGATAGGVSPPPPAGPPPSPGMIFGLPVATVAIAAAVLLGGIFLLRK